MATTAFYAYEREVILDDGDNEYVDVTVEYEYSIYDDDYYGDCCEIDIVKVVEDATKKEVTLTDKEAADLQGYLRDHAYEHAADNAYDPDYAREQAWEDDRQNAYWGD